MLVRIAPTSVLVHAPAKLNLLLEILAKRPDGFHEIETLMAPVDLYDTLELEPRADAALELTCRWAGGLAGRKSERGQLPQQQDNLAYRAAALLREQSGISAGATIRLCKRIPSQAGLGGASSDAAAALVAANLAWKLHWPHQHLADLAGRLGSDVPFFLAGGWAVCRGRGEQVEPVGGTRLNVVVVRPPEGLSTSEVYRRCRPATEPRGSAGLRDCLARGDWRRAKREMANGLAEAARQLSHWIARLERAFAAEGCLAYQMSGSGSSYFGIFAGRRRALRAAARLRAMQLGAVFCVRTVGGGGDPVESARG
jgi:4-diphosphocytidyl-2-C-methyl-D-erythritol kinase